MFSVDEIASWLPHFPYLGVFLFLVLGTTGFPFPEDTILIMSGFLAAQGVIDPVPAFLIIYPTLLMTDFVLFWSGKRFGRKVVEHRRFQRIVSPSRLQRLEEAFRKWGLIVILVGRLLPGLRAQIFLTAGVVKFPGSRFILADAGSALVTMGLMAGIGYAGAENTEVWKEVLSRMGEGVALGLAAILTGALLVKWLRRRRGAKTALPVFQPCRESWSKEVPQSRAQLDRSGLSSETLKCGCLTSETLKCGS
jgi:membrane protein DedA with SNARE-associated domain